MFLNLAVILIFGMLFDIFGAEFDNIYKLFEVMKKSENKEVKKNGIRFLEIFSKLEEEKTNKRFLNKIAEFLSGVILFDNDVDNLINSLKFFEANITMLDNRFFKQEGFLEKLIFLMRFLRHH